MDGGDALYLDVLAYVDGGASVVAGTVASQDKNGPLSPRRAPISRVRVRAVVFNETDLFLVEAEAYGVRDTGGAPAGRGLDAWRNEAMSSARVRE